MVLMGSPTTRQTLPITTSRELDGDGGYPWNGPSRLRPEVVESLQCGARKNMSLPFRTRVEGLANITYGFIRTIRDRSPVYDETILTG